MNQDKDAIVAIKGLHGAATILSKHKAGASLTQEAMEENFETNMAQGAEGFATMRKARTEELAAANKQLGSEEPGLVETDETNASSKKDLKVTMAELEVDHAFLADLKSRCSKLDAGGQPCSRRAKMRCR